MGSKHSLVYHSDGGSDTGSGTISTADPSAAALRRSTPRLDPNYASPLLIDFSRFKSLQGFPRYPDNKDLCIDASSIDPDGSLVVFISHAWLRAEVSDAAASSLTSTSHPDNKNNDSFMLCVEGIEKIKSTFAPGLACYVFCDYCCLDQNAKYNPYCYDFPTLYSAIGISDCLFTPIVNLDALPRVVEEKRQSRLTFEEYMNQRGEQSKEEHSPRKVQVKKDINNYYYDYKATNWNGERGYLNRSWCRLELFYGANIPFLPFGKTDPYCVDCDSSLSSSTIASINNSNSNSNSHRFNGGSRSAMKLSKITAGLKDRISKGERPHFIYSHRESVDRAYPILLPPVSNRLWSEIDDETGEKQNISYDPMANPPHSTAKGLLFNLAIKWKTYKLKKGLQPYIDSKKFGYHGPYKQGKRHGKGIARFQGGSVFEGIFQNNRRSGPGVCKYSNGDFIDGVWKGNKLRKGRYKFSSGNLYDGEYENGKRHGKGSFRWSSGTVYEGEYYKGKRHGKGSIMLPNGDVFEGEFSNGQSTGKGIFRLVNGDVYEGDFHKGLRHGFGTYRWIDGLVYEGQYKYGAKEGEGTLRLTNGDVYSGSWLHDVFEGHGRFVFAASGDVYEGEFFEGKKQGNGRFEWGESGTVFTGKFENDNMTIGSLLLKDIDPATATLVSRGMDTYEFDEVVFTNTEEEKEEINNQRYHIVAKNKGVVELKCSFINGKLFQ